MGIGWRWQLIAEAEERSMGRSFHRVAAMAGMLKMSAEPKVKAIASFLINSPLSVVPNA